jgi:hypothetical protein
MDVVLDSFAQRRAELAYLNAAKRAVRGNGRSIGEADAPAVLGVVRCCMARELRLAR